MNAGKIKLQQTAEEHKKSPRKAAKGHYDRLSFQSEEVGKGCARRIDREERSLRGAIDRSGSSFPKERVQREVEGGSEVGWEIQVVEVPTVL